MESLFCPKAASSFIIFSDYVPHLLYYSHIPPLIISILLGAIVFTKGKNILQNRLLSSMLLAVSLWLFFDLIVWASNDTRVVMLFWTLLILLEALLFTLSMYFIYVFINKRDLSFVKKILLSIPILPTLLLLPTKYTLPGIILSEDCEGPEGFMSVQYIYSIEVLIILSIILYSIFKYKKERDIAQRKQILYLSTGIILFLVAFIWGNLLGSTTLDWEISQYGLIGIPILSIFLAYLIVRFKAFDIKLLGTEVLVAALVIFVSAELFFAENATNQILILITMLISLGFGYMLVRSVKLEVQRKEELQMMSDKLAQANDKLTKLDNAKSEFISIASHQLRTPLTAIKGFISMLLEGSYGKIEAKQGDVLNKVYTSNERLIHLVEDLLNISRMESGRMEFSFAKTKIEDICQEVVDTFVIKASEHKLKLEYSPPKVAMPEAMIDGVKIREVISNLVDNAIKYTPKGSVTMRLEFVQGENQKVGDEKGSIRVIISDTGIGVPKTELPYLFSKFSRGKDVSRLNTGGTGLGLYVGKGMVETNGGQIWAESDGEGRGSRFIIELPVEQSEENMEKWG